MKRSDPLKKKLRIVWHDDREVLACIDEGTTESVVAEMRSSLALANARLVEAIAHRPPSEKIGSYVAEARALIEKRDSIELLKNEG